MCHLSLLAVLAFVVGANCCCVPEFYTADTRVRTQYKGRFYTAIGQAYYDYSAGIFASFHNYTDLMTGVNFLVSSHVDYNNWVVYTMAAGKCTKRKLDTSFFKKTDRPHCVPSAAKFGKAFVVGGPHDDIEMKTYSIRANNVYAKWMFTKYRCYPVQYMYLVQNSTEHDLSQAFLMQMANIELYIEDPTVFEIPKLCFTKPSTPKSVPGLDVDPWKFVAPFAYHAK